MNGKVIVVARYGLGSTAAEDADFGLEMLDKFLHTLEKRSDRPQAFCFYTEGVRCVVQGSPLVMGLQLLEGMGVEIVSCLTCLTRYGLQHKVAVGATAGMDRIVELMAGATDVLRI